MRRTRSYNNIFSQVLFSAIHPMGRSGIVTRQIPPRPNHLKLPFPSPCNWTREERMLAASHRGVLFNEQQRPCGRWWTASRKLSSPSFPGCAATRLVCTSRHSRTPRNSWPCPPSLPTVTRDNCCPLLNPLQPPSPTLSKIIAGVSTRARETRVSPAMGTAVSHGIPLLYLY